MEFNGGYAIGSKIIRRKVIRIVLLSYSFVFNIINSNGKKIITENDTNILRRSQRKIKYLSHLNYITYLCAPIASRESQAGRLRILRCTLCVRSVYREEQEQDSGLTLL